ncbi:formate dehydrogenase accessory sulfurtransferase FdhD [Microbulbifer bruguierae]|uniref:Sulfur carrier protein FdhD n=1 Tax=Microbulbifer bruguierae TaxID=3029061 RepID=A0ABY8NH83_9GAMM|nr:formate dehydrogenase accessory sulfurtransferase FdhD [Microbulbifer bruguierae]WGL17057.1 formate dehydrogenase accessory sulfurtransferase FdhD [Microbulbifer bruguierae]
MDNAYTYYVCAESDVQLVSTQSQPLAREVAVAISYNGINHAVMMATPEALDDFAFGFSITSGVISHSDQLMDLDIRHTQDAAELDITISQRAFNRLKLQRRAQSGSSGCGLCGIEALSQALAPIDSSQPGFAPALPPVRHFANLRQRFQCAQKHRKSSGAMHAALFVDSRGNTVLCREDIGRHNALDKLIGACARAGYPMAEGFAAMTSRCSLELVQKSIRAGVGTLASLSSPSDISVRWAWDYHLNLVHIPASGAPRVYSGSPASNQSVDSYTSSSGDSRNASGSQGGDIASRKKMYFGECTFS